MPGDTVGQRLADRRRAGKVIDTPAPSDEAVLLTEIRDLLAAGRSATGLG